MTAGTEFGGNGKVNREEIFQIIREILCETLEIEPEKVTESADLVKDLEGDSLLYLELFEEMKDRFNLKIDLHHISRYAKLKKVTTVGQLSEMVAVYLERGDEILKEIDQFNQAEAPSNA